MDHEQRTDHFLALDHPRVIFFVRVCERERERAGATAPCSAEPGELVLTLNIFVDAPRQDPWPIDSSLVACCVLDLGAIIREAKPVRTCTMPSITTDATDDDAVSGRRYVEPFPTSTVALLTLTATVYTYTLASLFPYVGLMVSYLLKLETTNDAGECSV